MCLGSRCTCAKVCAVASQLIQSGLHAQILGDPAAKEAYDSHLQQRARYVWNESCHVNESCHTLKCNVTHISKGLILSAESSVRLE